MINLKKIYKIYNNRDVTALYDISLEIKDGEFVAIMGESGSGKTTLMNILGCLDVATSGQYYLSGQEVTSMTSDQISEVRNREIGFVFQDFNLIEKLSAIENVELPLIFRGIPKDERRIMAEEALCAVGLEHRMKHTPAEMSGGQQQRVAIARVIAGNNKLILADEPTGNLDSKSAAEILKIIKDLWLSGHTVVLITHDNKIAEYAQRIVRIADGRIIDGGEC